MAGCTLPPELSWAFQGCLCAWASPLSSAQVAGKAELCLHHRRLHTWGAMEMAVLFVDGQWGSWTLRDVLWEWKGLLSGAGAVWPSPESCGLAVQAARPHTVTVLPSGALGVGRVLLSLAPCSAEGDAAAAAGDEPAGHRRHAGGAVSAAGDRGPELWHVREPGSWARGGREGVAISVQMWVGPSFVLPSEVVEGAAHLRVSQLEGTVWGEVPPPGHPAPGQVPHTATCSPSLSAAKVLY